MEGWGGRLGAGRAGGCIRGSADCGLGTAMGMVEGTVKVTVYWVPAEDSAEVAPGIAQKGGEWQGVGVEGGLGGAPARRACACGGCLSHR